MPDCLLVELDGIILPAFGFKGDPSFRCCRDLPDGMHQAVAVRVLPVVAATAESPAAGTLCAMVQRARRFWFRRRSIFELQRMKHR